MALNLESKFTQVFGVNAAPHLKAVAFDEIQQHPDIRGEIFSIESMDREVTQWTKISSYGQMEQVSEGVVAPKDVATQLGLKTFTALKFKKAIPISDEMIQDNRWDLVNKMVRGLGRAAYETQQVSAFNILNNAFGSETAFDGVAIISASHTTQSGNQSNIIASAADISYAGLKEGENYFRKVTDERGKHLILQPNAVLTTESFRHDALELVNTPFKPGSANNDINSLSALKVLSSPFLTDDDAWFMLAAPGTEANGLMIYNRQPLDSRTHEDALAGVMYYIAEYRQALGCSEWRGVWGSQGA